MGQSTSPPMRATARSTTIAGVHRKQEETARDPASNEAPILKPECASCSHQKELPSTMSEGVGPEPDKVDKIAYADEARSTSQQGHTTGSAPYGDNHYPDNPQRPVYSQASKAPDISQFLELPDNDASSVGTRFGSHTLAPGKTTARHQYVPMQARPLMSYSEHQTSINRQNSWDLMMDFDFSGAIDGGGLGEARQRNQMDADEMYELAKQEYNDSQS